MEPQSEREPSEDLVASLRAGIALDECFRQLFRTYYRSIHRFSLLRRFSPDESHDLAQETFLNAYRGIRGFRGDANLSTWLTQVAVNVWRNELRRRTAGKRLAREVPLDEMTDLAGEEEGGLESEWDDPLGDFLRGERRQILIREVSYRPTQMRRCVVLRALHDMKYHEVAAVLGISIQTVKSQLHQAPALGPT